MSNILGKLGGAFSNALTGGITSAVTGGLSSLLTGSQRSANKETFKQNMQLMDHANNLYMENWKLNNAYNSPAAQRQRLKQAGINPDLAFSGGLQNSSGSPAAVSEGTPMESYNPAEQVSHAVNSSTSLLNTIQGIRASDVEIKKGETELLTQYDRQIAELGKLLADTKDVKLKNYYQEQINKYVSDKEDVELQNMKKDSQNKDLQNEVLKETAISARYDNFIKSIDAKNYPQQKATELKQMAATLANTIKDGNLKVAQLEDIGNALAAAANSAEGSRARKRLADKAVGFTEKYLGKTASDALRGAIGLVGDNLSAVASFFTAK